MKIYTLEDFVQMDMHELFGFWCLIKLNSIELPEPKDYADAHRMFATYHHVGKICEYLASEMIFKV